MVISGISGVPPTCCFNLLFCVNQKKLALKEGRRLKKRYDGLFLTEDELKDCRKSWHKINEDYFEM